MVKNLESKLALVRLLLCTATTFILLFRNQGAPATQHLFPQWTAIMFPIYGLAVFLLLEAMPDQTVLRHLVVPFFDVSATIAFWQWNGTGGIYEAWVCFTLFGTVCNPSAIVPAAAGVVLLVGAVLSPYALGGLTSESGVRALFLVFFATILSLFFNAEIRRQRRITDLMESLRIKLSRVHSPGEATEAYIESLTDRLRPERIELDLGGAGPMVYVGDSSDRSGYAIERPIDTGSDSKSVCRILRRHRFDEDEVGFANMATDRLESALRIINLTRETVAKARLEENLEFADELHDTYLQTLAAIDLHTEGARRLVGRDRKLIPDLDAIRRIVRLGAQKARDFIAIQGPILRIGPEALKGIIEERWEGKKSVHIQSGLTLDDRTWQAIDMLVREGLNNSKRHSSPSMIDFTLSDRGGIVTATMTNDGCKTQNTYVFGYGLHRLDKVVRGAGGLLFVVSPGGDRMSVVAVFNRLGGVNELDRRERIAEGAG